MIEVSNTAEGRVALVDEIRRCTRNLGWALACSRQFADDRYLADANRLTDRIHFLRTLDPTITLSDIERRATIRP